MVCGILHTAYGIWHMDFRCSYFVFRISMSEFSSFRVVVICNIVICNMGRIPHPRFFLPWRSARSELGGILWAALEDVTV